MADIDLAYEGDAEALARTLARESGGSLVVLDDVTRVYRVAFAAGQLDVAAVQGGSIEKDLERRDFTINALARRVEPEGLGPLLDPRGGSADLRARRLRASGPQAFRDDPLRLLRAFRLAAQLGLEVDAPTRRWIRGTAPLVRRCAGERIRSELMALLSVPSSHRWLRAMDEARLLAAIVPELEKARSCARGYYGRGGVLRHTLDAVERMDLLLERLPAALPGLDSRVRDQLGRWGGPSAPALLRLAVLLHDIAKPATARRVEGRLRFFGHDERGARMTEKLMAKLRFSGRETAGVCACVRHHLRPGNLAVNREITPKAIYRFFRDLGDHGVPLLLVCWADHSSYMPLPRLRGALRTLGKEPGPPPRDPEKGKTVRHLRVITSLLRAYFMRSEVVRPERLLTGHDVMQSLGIPPGPTVGRVLARLEESQATGRVKDRETALRFIGRFKKRVPPR